MEFGGKLGNGNKRSLSSQLIDGAFTALPVAIYLHMPSPPTPKYNLLEVMQNTKREKQNYNFADICLRMSHTSLSKTMRLP